MKIFLSHPSNLKAFVRNVAEHLPAHVRSLIDEDLLQAGDDLTNQIKLTIKTDCDFMIVFINNETLDSRWVEKELRWALEEEDKSGRVFILPVLLADIPMADLLPELHDRMYLRCFDQAGDSVQFLAQRLAATLFVRLSQEWDKIKSAANAVKVSIIRDREHLYLSCARLISECKVIRDTTWGRTPGGLDASEKESRSVYRAAVDLALTARKAYRELFSTTHMQPETVEDVLFKMELSSQYKARIVGADLANLSMLDFMIGDQGKIIFSHVDAETNIPKFVYVESSEIADMFIQLFEECWVDADPIGP